MMRHNVYKKIPWICKVEEFFDGESLSKKKLDQLPERLQKFLVYQTMLTFSQFFSMIPDHNSEFVSTEKSNSSLKESLNATLPTWLSGLCDLRVFQIIEGLLEILSMRTEYKKYPPKSVMQFHAVCISIRPAAYHNCYKDTFKKEKILIEGDKICPKLKEQQDQDKHIQTMQYIYNSMKMDYKAVLKERMKKIATKQNRTEKENTVYLFTKNRLDRIIEIEKNTSI